MDRICRDCKALVPVEGGRYMAHHKPGTTEMCDGWFAIVNDEAGWVGHLESRFTLPRRDCQHPERWHSSDADSTEWEVSELVAALVGAIHPNYVIETGTAHAQTATLIGETLAEAGHGFLYTLEVDPIRVAKARDLVAGYPVEVVHTSSMEWTPAELIGFAWFDSLHHLRVPEFRRYYDHFTPGAIVGFHDTGPHQGTLRDEIAQLEDEDLLSVISLPTPRGVCFGQVLRWKKE